LKLNSLLVTTALQTSIPVNGNNSNVIPVVFVAIAICYFLYKKYKLKKQIEKPPQKQINFSKNYETLTKIKISKL